MLRGGEGNFSGSGWEGRGADADTSQLVSKGTFTLGTDGDPSAPVSGWPGFAASQPPLTLSDPRLPGRLLSRALYQTMPGVAVELPGPHPASFVTQFARGTR